MEKHEVVKELLARANAGDADSLAVLSDFAAEQGMVVSLVENSVGFNQAAGLLVGQTVTAVAGSKLTLDSGVVIDIALDGE